jgi:exopolysaccharide biosynthesis polyprenyl glycosylphosphotransferase
MSDTNLRAQLNAPHSSAESEGHGPQLHPAAPGRMHVLREDAFLHMLCLERKRAERSGRTFLLVLLDAVNLFEQSKRAIPRVTSAVCSAMRETDLIGWQQENAVIGVILTEIGTADKSAIRRALLSSLTSALRTKIEAGQADLIQISFHFFPDEEGHKGARSADKKLYPELQWEGKHKRASRLVKRAMDVAGSLAALILLSPLLALIAAAIKLTSKGPVIFKQGRVGQHGEIFQFLKFRSMLPDSDPRVHREFVNEFIGGSSNPPQPGKPQRKVFKITDDPRVTRVGAILRRTSLDELPQFWNVLKGEMSLVGPRPPIPYELESYRIWHKRRILEVKPGITGLWQVYGRSRTTFDEMVRLDLRYARTWSILLDLKILVQTPRAIFSQEGAY